jgi:hypothetical protein
MKFSKRKSARISYLNNIFSVFKTSSTTVTSICRYAKARVFYSLAWFSDFFSTVRAFDHKAPFLKKYGTAQI